MGIAALLDDPLFLGSTATTEVPGRWPVALDGRGFMVDESDRGFLRQSIQLLRQQADTADRPSERSINPEDLWRRAAEDWHLGAGQTRFDRSVSDPARYYTSKGVDPWTRWQLTLLHDTTLRQASANTNLYMAVSGTYLYVADGTTLRVTTDLASWSTVTYGGGTIKSITSDGYNVYVTDGVNIYQFQRGAGTAGAAWSAADADLLVYVKGKGRLMAALNTGVARSVYNITGAGAPTDIAPTTIVSADFTWVGFAEGPAAIYGAGWQGDKSLVFRWGVKSDGTGLDAAIPALPDGLPDGEIVRAVSSYLGFVLLGTDKGVRFCVPDSAGNLTLGPLIPTGQAVKCFEGQDRFVWYGLTNFDTTSTGLGRLDLSVDTGTANIPTPAYASDLMATGQGAVVDVATFGNVRVFTVAGLGVYSEATTLVSSGFVQAGRSDFGLPDNKVAMYLDLRHEPLDGSIAAAVDTDVAGFVDIGGATTQDSTAELLPVGQRTGTTFDVKLTLARSTLDTTQGPVVTRWTLLANPAPRRRQRIPIRLVIGEMKTSDVNAMTSADPLDDLSFIVGLWQAQRGVRFQAGRYTATVTVEDWEMDHRSRTDRNRDYWNGIATVVLKVLE